MENIAKMNEKMNSSAELSPNNKIKAVIYARSATSTCNNQITSAKNFVKQHPNIDLTDILIDEGINNINRPAFNQLLELIKDKKIDVIIVKSLSRLFRSMDVAFELQNLCVQYDVCVYTLESSSVMDWDIEGNPLANVCVKKELFLQ